MNEISAIDGPVVPNSTRRALILIFFCITALFHGRLLLAPFQETVSAALDLDDRAIAWLQGPALTFPVALLAVPLGLLIDRVGRVRLMLAFGFMGLVGAVLTAAARDFSQLLGARILAGLAASAANTVVLSLICDLVPPAKRGRSITLVSMGQYAGMASAFGLGGWLLARTGSADWRIAASLSIVPLVAALLLPAFVREPGRDVRRVGAATSGAAFTALWHSRGQVAPVLAAIAALEVALGAMLIWAAPALIRSYGLAPELVGSAMATGLIASGVVGTIGGGLIADWAQKGGGAPRLRGRLAGLLALCGAASLFPVLPTPLVGVPVLVVALIGLAAAGVMAIALYSVVTPTELRGLAMGMLTATGVIAFGAAPLLVSVITDWLGGPARLGVALASLCSAASLLAALCLVLGPLAPAHLHNGTDAQ